jgi:Protein of unknown function (DUF3795)
MISACGVICSECPAYLGAERGIEHQQRSAEAWQRIYGRKETAEQMTCRGCLGPDEAVFYTSVGCRTRLCCMSKGFSTCAECPLETCQDLEEAQSVWDEVPLQIDILSTEDFARYAQPYCDHRPRLAALRVQFHVEP